MWPESPAGLHVEANEIQLMEQTNTGVAVITLFKMMIYLSVM